MQNPSKTKAGLRRSGKTPTYANDWPISNSGLPAMQTKVARRRIDIWKEVRLLDKVTYGYLNNWGSIQRGQQFPLTVQSMILIDSIKTSEEVPVRSVQQNASRNAF